MTNTSQQPRTGLVTLILVGSTFLSGLDLFIVNVAFDDIGRDFAAHDGTASLGQLSWILNAYAVVFAALLVPMGRLTDRYGRKRGFVAGLVLFTAASGACGLANGVWMLVGFRVVQAVGAAAMTPASLGLLLAALPAERRAPAARLWALTGAVAAAFGPAVGGGLVQVSWHWAFWINLPVGVLLVVGALRFVPDVRHNEGAPRPDLTGGIVFALAVGALVLGTVQGNDWGWSSDRVIGAYVVAVAGFVAFAWLTAHHPSPIVDPALLRVRSFSWASATSLVFNAGFGAGLLAGILWMEQVWGYSALRTGLGVALGPVLVPITSVLAHRLLPRVRAGTMVVAGCLVSAASATLMATSLSTTPAYLTTLLPAWALMGIAVGLAMPNLVASATVTLPVTQVSTGSGVVNMARQVGLVVGVSVLVAIVGSGSPLDSFRTAWLVIAGVSFAGALSASMIGTSRRPDVAVVEASAASAG